MGAELIALFEDSVLEVHHLDVGARFTVGESPHADLPWAGLGPLRELVRVGTSGIEVVYADDVGVELLDGSDAPQWTRELPHDRRVAVVPAGQRARLTLGALTLLVAPGERPTRHALEPTLGWREHLVTAVVGVLALLCLLALSSIPESPSSLALDDTLVMQRLARFVIEPPVPPPTHDAGAMLASTGGRTSAPAPLRRPSAPERSTAAPKKAGDPRASRDAAIAAASHAGIVDLLQGSAHVGSIFGASSAFGAGGQAAFGELQGVEGGGCGACATGPLVQGGPGGNGTSIAAGPIASHDGGPRIGPRLGLPVRHTSPIDGLTTDVGIIGNYDRSMIRRVVRSHMAEFRFCYERELQHDASLSGRVVPRFTLDPTGRVIAAVLESSSMHNAAVESCVLQATRRMEFPRAPPGAGLTIVSYPFGFKSAAQN